MTASIDAAGASLTAVRAELARTPAVSVGLTADAGAGGESGRVRLQLRPEPYHDALVATQQARPCPSLATLLCVLTLQGQLQHICSEGGSADGAAQLLAHFDADPRPPASLVAVQELMTELAAARGALAAAQQGLGALSLHFGEGAAGAAGEGDVMKILAAFSAQFTAAQRQVQHLASGFTFL